MIDTIPPISLTVSAITSLSLELDGKSPYVEFRALVKHPETTRHFHSTTIVAVLIKMIRQIFRPNYMPYRLQLMGQINLATEQQYVDHFGCAIEYNCDSTRIFLNRDELDLALPAENAELCRQLDGLVIKYLETLSKTSLTAKVKELLIASLPANNFARESIAKQLYMSPRTFHDKLKKENTSFQQLLDETRQELACRYLEEMKVPVGELTHLLGFADSSSFTRAFKRWYGVAPSRYKKTFSSSS
ncbi:AraC family transcriptional regulator [Thalassotalea sp. Y01]|uniref:helix-turn-helix domain-containing protein n=1 Tax=Thalassotalea sp. Y01 TaxID=2729613 RepID=UPI00145D2150|nr:AraC family transcriptional regulator [Thalassotalea sp. Y01]